MKRRTKYEIYADLLKTVMKRGSYGATRGAIYQHLNELLGRVGYCL